MKCIAFHVRTGKRCVRPVGKSRRALRYKLCATHSRSTVLCLLASSTDSAAMSRENWTHVITHDVSEVVRTTLRRSLVTFGAEVTRRALDAAAQVPMTGHLDTYLASVMAVVVPMLEAHIETKDKANRAMKAETDALNARTDAMIAQQTQWGQWLANMKTSITH
jgi:hypothetical protein